MVEVFELSVVGGELLLAAAADGLDVAWPEDPVEAFWMPPGGRGIVGRLRLEPDVTGGVGLLRLAAPRPLPFLVALVVGGSGGGG